MEHNDVYELSAPYALDALDENERRRFEDHLAHCEECRTNVGEFHQVAASLAYGVEAHGPPAGLRERVLAQARREQRIVVALRPRWTKPVAAAAAIAACAALALGIWAATLHRQLSDRPEAIPLDGANGTLIVAPTGDATLVVRNLAAAPAGKTYEAWVIKAGKPQPAGLFTAGEERTAVALAEPVADDASVAVTLEKTGGAPQPTGAPLITATTE